MKWLAKPTQQQFTFYLQWYLPYQGLQDFSSSGVRDHPGQVGDDQLEAEHVMDDLLNQDQDVDGPVHELEVEDVSVDEAFHAGTDHQWEDPGNEQTSFGADRKPLDQAPLILDHVIEKAQLHIHPCQRQI